MTESSESSSHAVQYIDWEDRSCTALNGAGSWVGLRQICRQVLLGRQAFVLALDTERTDSHCTSTCPPNGVYIGWASISSRPGEVFKAMISVGNNPSFNQTHVTIVMRWHAQYNIVYRWGLGGVSVWDIRRWFLWRSAKTNHRGANSRNAKDDLGSG
jgi:hypothetical protein